MTDHPTAPIPETPGSGNRWEPTAPPADGGPPAAPPPSGPPPADPPPAPPGAPARSRFRPPSRNAWFAGAIAAAFVLVAAGGFVVGRATADGDGQGFDGDRGWHQVPPQGGFPGGQQDGQQGGPQDGAPDGVPAPPG